MLDIFRVNRDKILSVVWTGNSEDYDQKLYELEKKQKKFLVVNPYMEKFASLIVDDLKTNKCVVWKFQNQWIAKRFVKGWNPTQGYQEVIIIKPIFIWKKNPDLDPNINYIERIYSVYEPEPWDWQYELIWYIDPKFNPQKEKVWAFSCKPLGEECRGTKDMGYVSPDISFELNKKIPNFNLVIDKLYPAYYDLDYECVYLLDQKHTNDKDIWVIKFYPNYRKSKGQRKYGTILPKFKIIYNPDLPKMDYTLNYNIPWYDMKYEHIWMLDRKHLKNGEDDIWAFKIISTDSTCGSKIIDFISPNLYVDYNPELPSANFNIDYTVSWHDFGYVHTWLLDKQHYPEIQYKIWAVKIYYTLETIGNKDMWEISPIPKISYNDEIKDLNFKIDYIAPYFDWKFSHTWHLDPTLTNGKKIWAAKLDYCTNPSGQKEMGLIVPQLSQQFDVIFISYNEINAEKNWKRLLKKAPWAKRVQGVKGIFQAHKAAAKLSSTEMFYVVDGDAWIVDDFNFDYKPGIFDLDCTYIWKSQNPYNNLNYGYGGVKLFSRSKLLKMKKWTKTDLTLSVSKKIKVMDSISNITYFNTDEFNTWKSAFREAVKLSQQNNLDFLISWVTKEKVKFSKFAKMGVNDGISYFNKNKNNPINLLKINDFNWLIKTFKKK